MEDKSRSGRPSSSKTNENVEAMRQAGRGNRRLTVRRIAEQVGIDRQTIWQIITEELRMRKIRATMVLKLLSDDQKRERCRSARTGSIISRMTPNFPPRSLRETKLGCLNMTWRRSNRASNGSAPARSDPRKRVSQGLQTSN